MSLLDWGIVLVYFVASAAIGVYYARRAGGSTEDFFHSGRSLPWWLAGISMLATTFAADTPLVVTELVAKNGIAGNWIWWVQGVVQFNVSVILSEADEDVRPGMTAAVNIIVEQLDGVLLVPNPAVRLVDGKRVVILKDQQLVAVQITLGATSDTESEVIEGDLNVGDLIVLNPPQNYESSVPPFMGG